MLVFPARRPLVLSRPVSALVVARIGDSAVIVADRAVVLSALDDGTLMFGQDAPKLVLQESIAVGLAGQVGYETNKGTVDLREEILVSTSRPDPVAGVRRLFEEHADGIRSVPGVHCTKVDGLECPAATIAVVVREFRGAAAIDVIGLAEDGLARSESLNPFGGGAYAPRGPILDALQHELAKVHSDSVPEQVVESLASAIRATVHHADGAVTAELDAVIVKPGQTPEFFEVPFPPRAYDEPGAGRSDGRY